MAGQESKSAVSRLKAAYREKAKARSLLWRNIIYDLYDLYAQYEMTAAATEQNLTHSVVSNVLTAMTLQLPQWQVCTCDMLQIQQA